MSASMAEVFAEVLTTHGSWRYTKGAGSAIVCRGCGAPVGNIIVHQAEQLAANGYGKLGFEGGIWTMTDAEFKQELANARVKALEDAADAFAAKLPDGTGNGRAYNSYQVARMLRARVL